MAEWLRRGLQILARRFDSGSGLQTCSPDFMASFPTPGIAPFPDGKLTMGGIQRNSDRLPQRQRAAPCGTALPLSYLSRTVTPSLTPARTVIPKRLEESGVGNNRASNVYYRWCKLSKNKNI